MDAFKEGEEYDFVTDLRRGFKGALEKPLEDKLIEQLPDYVFWDVKPYIKTKMEETYDHNRANPMKPQQYRTFFDYRNTLEYFHNQTERTNVADHKSLFRRY